MKTTDLIGPALRYAVAMAGDWNGSRTHTNPGVMVQVQGYRPDILWEHGGPIIEREGITVGPWATSPFMAHVGHSYGEVRSDRYVGPTPLIAAMRCFVASKLGDEVDVPKELM